MIDLSSVFLLNEVMHPQDEVVVVDREQAGLDVMSLWPGGTQSNSGELIPFHSPSAISNVGVASLGRRVVGAKNDLNTKLIFPLANKLSI